MLQVILKPAEATPLTALALAELGRRAGLPPGVLNIVVGEAKKIGKPVPAYEIMSDHLVHSCAYGLLTAPFQPNKQMPWTAPDLLSVSIRVKFDLLVSTRE